MASFDGSLHHKAEITSTPKILPEDIYIYIYIYINGIVVAVDPPQQPLLDYLTHHHHHYHHHLDSPLIVFLPLEVHYWWQRKAAAAFKKRNDVVDVIKVYVAKDGCGCWPSKHDSSGS
jgi:hypothetical protein